MFGKYILGKPSLKTLAKLCALTALTTLVSCGGGGGGGGSGGGASGRISLAINVDGTRTHVTSQGTEVKKELGFGTLVYHLANGVVQTSGSGRSADWMNASFGGATTQTSEHSTTYQVICNGGLARPLTDKTITSTAFSSASGGQQVTGVGVQIAADGSYTLVIGIPTSLTAATSTTVRTMNPCEVPPSTETRSGPSPVPFSHYFAAYTGGKTGGLTGTIDPAEPNRVKGVYAGRELVPVFTNGSNPPITMPFEYTITWDIFLGQ